jgi:hypothetical protein
MLAPLTSLVGDCLQTKITSAKVTKKVPWHWDEVHQRAFDHVKATIAREVVLAYPDYSKVFEIYTDASSKQLGAVITQENRRLRSLLGNSPLCSANTLSPKLNYLP